MSLRRVPWRGRLTTSVIPVCQWDKETSASRAVPVRVPGLQRHVSSIVKKGSGGRSSFSGVVATVFGATGFVGRYMVNRLGKVGTQVTVPYRGDEHDHRHLRLMGDLGQILFYPYSIRDKESVKKMVEHSNVVINLVGRDYETRNFSFSDVHVEGARVIAEACAECGVKQLIHFSAVGADQESTSTFLQSKAFGEEVVKEAFPDAVIVRPADIYGHEDRFLRYYASLRIFPFGLIPVLNRGVGITKRPVYVGDVAGGVVQLINEGVSKSTYEFTGPREYELGDLIQHFFGVMYRPCRMYAPPHWLYNMAAYILEQNPFIPYMTRDMMKRLHMCDAVTPNTPGLEDLGVSPAYMEDTIIAMLRMFRSFENMDKPIEDTHPEYQDTEGSPQNPFQR